jgi:hypothetical protein
MTTKQLKDAAVCTGVTATLTESDGLEHWAITRHYADGTKEEFTVDKKDLQAQHVASLASILVSKRSGDDR